MMSTRMRAALTVVALVAAATLSGCVSHGTSTPDPRLIGTWHLGSASVNGGLLNLGDAPLDFVIGDAAHTYVASNCGSQKASVTGGVGAVYVHISPHIGQSSCFSTADAALSRTYLRALGATSFASIADGSLVLSSPTASLIYLRRALTPSSDFRHTSWTLASVPLNLAGSSAQPTTPATVTLAFEGNTGITVKTPCSQITANYQQQGSVIAVGAYTTKELRPDCPPADLALEGITLALLRGALMIHSSSDGIASDSWLVITNLSNDVPSVWHANDVS
jgi:heat shock protein HslJ